MKYLFAATAPVLFGEVGSMANKKLLTNVIALLPLAAGLAALCFAPEEIPLGFDSSGAPDEWGSRWTLLSWPRVVLALRLALAGLGRLAALDKDGAHLAAFMDTAAFAVTAFFAIIALYKLALPMIPGLDMSQNARQARICQLASALVGVLFIAAGDWISTIPYNKNTGLKTRHTLADKKVWQAAHAFWGRASTASGICTVVLALFLRGVWSLVAALVLFALAAVSAAVYAGRYARRL